MKILPQSRLCCAVAATRSMAKSGESMQKRSLSFQEGNKRKPLNSGYRHLREKCSMTKYSRGKSYVVNVKCKYCGSFKHKGS